MKFLRLLNTVFIISCFSIVSAMEHQPNIVSKQKPFASLVRRCAQVIAHIEPQYNNLSPEVENKWRALNTILSDKDRNFVVKKLLQSVHEKPRIIGSFTGKGTISPDGTKILINNKRRTFIQNICTGLTKDSAPYFMDIRKWSNKSNPLFIKKDIFSPRAFPYLNEVIIWLSDNDSYQILDFPNTIRKYKFSSNDNFLITEDVDDCWIIYSTNTKKPLLNLGSTINTSKITIKTDPSESFIPVLHGNVTWFYPTKNFPKTPPNVLTGRLCGFSTDGKEIIMHHDSKIIIYNKTEKETLKETLSIAYPDGQYIQSILINTKKNKLLVHTVKNDYLFNLKTGLNIHRKKNNSLLAPDKEFFSNDLKKIVELQKIGRKNSRITIKTVDKQIIYSIDLPEKYKNISNIYYTPNPNYILCGEGAHVRYLLDLRSPTLIPITFKVRRNLFSHKVSKNISNDGKFIVSQNEDSQEKQIMQLPPVINTHTTHLVDIIAYRVLNNNFNKQHSLCSNAKNILLKSDNKILQQFAQELKN